MANRIRGRMALLQTVLVSMFRSCIGSGEMSHLKKVDLLLTCHDNDRGSTVDGKPYAQITDSIAFFAELLGHNTLTVAKPYSSLIGHRAYGCPASINFKSFCLTLLSYSLLGFKRRRLVLALKTRMWINLLGRTDPKMVIGVQPSEDLCAACKALGVPVYDVQHGVINEQHPWYSSRIKLLDERLLPSGFLVWDEVSAHSMSAAIEKGLAVSVIGHPAFLRYGHEKSSQPGSSPDVAEERRPVNILITLQWGLEDVFPMPEEKGLMGLGLIRVIKNSDEHIRWHIRMHPVQLRQKYERTYSDLLSIFGDSKNIEITHATVNPLPMVLSLADLHITYHSTVVVEAGWMGIPSAILCPEVESGRYSSYYQAERNSGIAECVKCSEMEIRAWIGAKAHGSKNLNSMPEGRITEFLSASLK